MTIGLPGTGIGGLFYIAAALVAPLRSGPRRSALYVATVAIAVLVGMFATGWLIALMLGPALRPFIGAVPSVSVLPSRFAHVHNILRWTSLAPSALVLAFVLFCAQLARLLQRRSGR